MTEDEPGPGKRVRQIAPEYKGTGVYHALYLPLDWKPGGKFPVIVEYTGNKWAPSGSTGDVRDSNLGYGISGGQGFIWVCMPYVEKGRQTNAVTWWGDRQATVDYCKFNLPRICDQFGGDHSKVFICGFSRGAIGASYIGLADDEISSFWKGMFTHDHFDGQNENWGYPECDRASALKRLARLKGRAVLVSGMGADYLREHLDLARFTFLTPPVAELFDIPEGKVIHPHTDLWMHKESRYRQKARAWLANMLNDTWNKYGTQNSTLSWDQAANWGDGTGSNPNAIGDGAVIQGDIYNPGQTIQLNRQITLGSLQVGDTLNLQSFSIIPNGGSLVFQAASGNASLTRTVSTNGTDRIRAAITLNSTLTRNADSAPPPTRTQKGNSYQ